ncbi:uncharacterized protein LOC113288024 [Papaver somniferum]|uniref:uncharacterized protein LOC113288024 n=1 Tax=Papaver somniferum TaxID=3469 RepID=UPI000E701CD2|nr:uncharacterized protein LOC113288024 [Papaver somniferum]XP_026392736.1 uncharacterized protein LOC113288024 [Papaver somniferum]
MTVHWRMPYVKAGELLMEKRKNLYWYPCAAHCINLMLEDFGNLPMHHDAVEKAKFVSTYIYKRSLVVNLMREHGNGRDLTRAGSTRFATNYLNLKSFRVLKAALRKMFTSEAWTKSRHAKEKRGKKVQEIILGDANFWLSIISCLKSVTPLVKVLRLVEGDDKPAMGYIYKAIDRAKEQIQVNFKNVRSRYIVYTDIIELRWNTQLHGPLHAAGYFLNPRYHCSPDFHANFDIKKVFYDVVKRMCSSAKERINIDKQVELFTNAGGMFGHVMAKDTRDKKHPALWWNSYGYSAPELQRVAVRVLSSTCSATGCERNWSEFEQVHTKRRNRLSQQRLNALVYVKYNLRLNERFTKRQEEGDSYDPICLSDMESDDEWITEKEDPTLERDPTWMDVHECFEITEAEANKKKRKRGPRNLSTMKLAQGKGSSKGKEITAVHADEIQEVEEDDIEGDYMEEMEDFERIETPNASRK